MGGQPQQQNQGWTQPAQPAPQGGMGAKGGPGGYSSPYQGGMNSVLSGLQSTAPMQYMQIQNMPPGPQRDQLIKQAQGTDNGAGFNAAMKGAGFQLNPTPDASGNYTYNAPPGGGNTFTGGGSPAYQGMGQGGGGAMKGGGPAKGGGRPPMAPMSPMAPRAGMGIG